MEGKKDKTQQTSKASRQPKTKQTSKPSAVPKQRFTVKKWSGVALWAWDVKGENCGICRNHIMEKCIYCEANEIKNEECVLAWGTCNHAYHFHCISPWLKVRNVCPLDMKKWESRIFPVNRSDICAICKIRLLDKCIACEANQRVDGCPLVWGTCGHVFHLHSISAWFEFLRGEGRSEVCPLDNIKWECKKLKE